MADVKLLEPQRLTDNPDGGGLATANEIVDGQINNVFGDISRIDRVNGEVSLRKVFIKADTADTDTFVGVHTIVQLPPADDRVSCVLFRTDGWADERSDAQELVERYLDESVISRWIPYDRQLAGQRAVLLFGRPDFSLPEIGEVYVLKNETLATPTFEFIRVANLSHEVQTFTDDLGDFLARVVTLTITQPLTQEFAGTQPNRYFTANNSTSSAANNKSILRRTLVSDAARFKGTTPLSVDADVGDLTLKVGSVYAQLAPSAASEAAVVDAEAAGASANVQAATASVSTAIMLGAQATGAKIFLPRGVTPGSIGPAPSLTDDGAGNIYQSGVKRHQIDYASGEITTTNLGVESSVLTYIPAASVSKAAATSQQAVTVSTRGYVYTHTCDPLPKPGAVTVSYRAAGRWYDLNDDGAGVISGDSGAGSGAINYSTGSILVSLGALPDIGSSIVFAWGGASEYEVRTGDTAITPPRVTHTLSSGNCEPSTLAITWTAGGVGKTATDDGAGAIAGDATGRIVYATGELSIQPTLLPDPTTTFEFDYDAAAVETELFNPTKSGSTITMTVASGPIRVRSLLITYQQGYTSGPLSITTTQQLTDNGSGELVDAAGNVKAGSVVNYATGQISFNPDFTAVTPVLSYERFEQQLPARTADPSTGYFAAVAEFGTFPTACGSESSAIAFANGSNVTVQYKTDAAVDGAQADSLAAPPLRIDLTPGIVSPVVPGSVMFTFGGRTYIDRSGTLYYGVSTSTGAAIAAGTIDYASGVATITSWVAAASPTLTKQALLAQVSPLPVTYLTGRTPGSPLRPASFFVRALRYDTSAQISATADVNGNISTATMHGYVDVTTGVFSIRFGAFELDASLSAEDKAQPWYNAVDVDAEGYVFRPIPIIPGSLKFNCVIQTTLPLDPEIIGINPVRLPLDGRVQMIRAGDTLVIHDSITDALAAPVAGATVSLSRTNLESAVVYDTDGTAVDPLQYTVDRSAGTLQWADPLDLSSYTAPYTALQTIADMALCTDAMITGDITIAQPLTHGFTAANSYVSSALVLGDAQARYQGLFELNTWGADWDATTGTAPTSGAQYNDLTYPIAVTNRDAITQKWRIQFTSSTAFNVVAEELGVLAAGTTSVDVAPVNPATGQPYFTIPAAGFGAGWATGNVIRFDTVAAGAPVWLARTTKPGPAEVTDDLVKLQLRWDKD